MKEALSGDEKAAKSLHSACKASLDPTKKRSASELETSSLSSETAKRARKSAYQLDDPPQTPAELEASLALPAPSREEEDINRTVLLTNRAPLVLAFAYALLGFTRPEQPGSSRLSLAQAVVSANSKSKAVALGLREAEKDGGDGWGTGQPRIRVLGREIAVLKRGGYEWREDSESKEQLKVQSNVESDNQGNDPEASSASKPSFSLPITKANPSLPPQNPRWLVSSPTTLKKSTFIGRAIEITSSADAKKKLSQLLASNPDLASASHNITALRLQRPGFLAGIVEECNDDGETGGGRHLLRILQDASTFGILLVCTRWYGGIMLGPDRWKLMSEVCREALSQRLRVAGIINVSSGGGDALWGLDLTEEAVKSAGAGQMPICRPEGARSYILKAFASSEPSLPSAPSETSTGNDIQSPIKKVTAVKKKTGVALEREKEHNLSLLIGALNMLFESWKGHISAEELDRRAWGWYVQVRPEVEAGVAGWGGKGEVKLRDILGLRRKG